jgi:hypothetical protein
MLRALGPPCVLLMKILTAGRPELCIPEAQVVKSSQLGSLAGRPAGGWLAAMHLSLSQFI